MPYKKDERYDRVSKNSKRGSVDNKRRLAAFGERKQNASGDWGECSSERLQGVILGITGLGGAVTFGLSRDGGAYMLTLLLDQDKETLWFNADADLNEELDAIMAKLENMKQ